MISVEIVDIVNVSKGKYMELFKTGTFKGCCTVCYVEIKNDISWHGGFCPHRPFAQLQSDVKILEHNAKAYKIWEERMRKNVVFWQGKFAIVKEENNALRKKIKSLTKT